MSDITELATRISAALGRIEQAVASAVPPAPVEVAPAPSTSGDIDALQDALDAERTANAQLTERVRAIKEKQETMVSALERKVARLTEQLDAANVEVQRLRQANEDLTATNRALSDAAERGMAQPDLINRSMHTELEALRAQRAADLAEMDEILSELKPLIGEVA